MDPKRFRTSGTRKVLMNTAVIKTMTAGHCFFVNLQEAICAAEMLMNRVAAGESQWDNIRDELADKYLQGGQKVISDFIKAAA